MKKCIRSFAFIVLPLTAALVLALYAEPIRCIFLANFCTSSGGCGGEYTLVVYGSGGCAVECFSPPQSPCQPYWITGCVCD